MANTIPFLDIAKDREGRGLQLTKPGPVGHKVRWATTLVAVHRALAPRNLRSVLPSCWKMESSVRCCPYSFLFFSSLAWLLTGTGLTVGLSARITDSAPC
jgi:hypothetical protein